MTLISEVLNQATVGEPVNHLNLSMFPIMLDAVNDPDYLLLDDAVKNGCARITEMDESGSVPELKFYNNCDKPVLLLDGEELVGAKQNRIINLTVLVPANSEMVIPVSCVEAGRWHSGQSDVAEFSVSDRVHYASGRASKMCSVSESIRYSKVARSDQSEVWNDISAKASRMNANSQTSASEAMYETHRHSIADYLKGCQAVDGQSGALFAINGKPVGLDLFDSPGTFSRLLNKLVQSYALDAIDLADGNDETESPDTDTSDIALMVDEVAGADIESFDSIGLGKDLRLSSNYVTGGALENQGRVIHLCAFRLNESQSSDRKRHSMSSALHRRSRYQE